MMRNRSSGVFDPPLIGPFEFIAYKDPDRYACWLQDEHGIMFDCSVAHITPFVERDILHKRRRSM